MTRKETVRNLLTELIDFIDNGSQRDLDRADEIGASIIKLFEQESSEDCISREAVLETIETCNNDGLKGIFCSYDDGKRFEAYIKDLPSVTPKEKTGRWYIRETYPLECKSWECSECKEVVYEKTKCCPNCGVRMVEPQESEVENGADR